MTFLSCDALAEITYAILTRRELTDDERRGLVFELAALRRARGCVRSESAKAPNDDKIAIISAGDMTRSLEK